MPMIIKSGRPAFPRPGEEIRVSVECPQLSEVAAAVSLVASELALWRGTTNVSKSNFDGEKSSEAWSEKRSPQEVPEDLFSGAEIIRGFGRKASSA